MMAWLGLGLSLASLLAIWAMNAYVVASFEHLDSPVAPAYAVTFVIAAILGTTGLIASVIGLTVKRFAVKRWICVGGIVLCGLSLMSVPATYIMLQRIMMSKALEIRLPDAPPVPFKAPDVVIELDTLGILRCYDNRRGDDTAPHAVALADDSACEQLNAWLHTNEITQDNNITIRADRDTPYPRIDSLFTLLKGLDIKRFSITTTVHEDD